MLSLAWPFERTFLNSSELCVLHLASPIHRTKYNAPSIRLIQLLFLSRFCSNFDDLLLSLLCGINICR